MNLSAELEDKINILKEADKKIIFCSFGSYYDDKYYYSIYCFLYALNAALINLPIVVIVSIKKRII